MGRKARVAARTLLAFSFMSATDGFQKSLTILPLSSLILPGLTSSVTHTASST